MNDNPYQAPQATESRASAPYKPPLQFFFLLKWIAVLASIQFVIAILIRALSPTGSVAQYWASEVTREGAGLAFTLCVVYFIMKMRRWRAEIPMA